MKLKVYSIGYSDDEKKMLKYKEALIKAGIHVCGLCLESEGSIYWQVFETYIVVDINTSEDFIKITDAVGQIIFDGDTVMIYDGYYE